jgi:hypothetical protein
MRKHRPYGVAIAVLLATTPFHQWPGSPRHQPPSHHLAVALQLTSAKLPAGRVGAAPTAGGSLFAAPASPAPRALEALWARANFLASRIPPPAPPPAPPAPETPLASHPPSPSAPARPPPAVATSPGPPRPTVVAAPTAPGAGTPGVWAALRSCESGGNYADDTGNGYYGAYQFSLSTWRGLGLSGLPSQASPAAQDQAAQQLQARSGWGQWPSCARQLGLL